MIRDYRSGAAVIIGAGMVMLPEIPDSGDIRYFGEYKIPEIVVSDVFTLNGNPRGSKYGDIIWIECHHDLDGDGKPDAKTYHKILDRNRTGTRKIVFDIRHGDAVVYVIASWPFAYQWDRNGNGILDAGDEPVIDPNCRLDGDEMPESDWLKYVEGMKKKRGAPPMKDPRFKGTIPELPQDQCKIRRSYPGSRRM